MLYINKNNLVEMGVCGKVSPPEGRAGRTVCNNGETFLGPRTGGICYNVKVGDSAFGWAGDHIEPCVSTRATDEANSLVNGSYNMLCCIGNKVKIISGDAKGCIGIVTGKHGGSERVMIDFSDDVLEKISYDDKFMVRTIGQGLKVNDFNENEFAVMNIDPSLLDNLNIQIKNGIFMVGVAHFVPSCLMGSGIGSITVGAGDYDITTQDKDTIKKYDLDQIKLGDIVALTEQDGRYGRTHNSEYVSIGVVIHCDSDLPGHGPGVTTIMTAKKDLLVPVEDKHANIAKILKIGRHRV